MSFLFYTQNALLNIFFIIHMVGAFDKNLP